MALEDQLSEGTRKLIAMQNRLSQEQKKELLKMIQEETGGSWKTVMAEFPDSKPYQRGIQIEQPKQD